MPEWVASPTATAEGTADELDEMVMRLALRVSDNPTVAEVAGLPAAELGKHAKHAVESFLEHVIKPAGDTAESALSNEGHLVMLYIAGFLVGREYGAKDRE